MNNLKLKSDLVQSIDELNFYSYSLLSNFNIRITESSSLFSKADTFVTSLFNNSNINFTENKSSLHFVPRFFGDKEMFSKYPNIFNDLDFMFKTDSYINSSKYSNITDIIHLGSGGSNLGPKLIYNSFSHISNGPNVHFISNLDPLSLNKMILKLNPINTLIISVSKSFSTYETQENLKKIKAWFLNSSTEELFYNNLFFITSFPEKALQYGLSSSNIIKLDSSIGGRFSIWSSSNLINAIVFGKKFFINFLNGGRFIDNIIINNIEKSLPYILALKSFYFRKYHNIYNHIIVPYSDQLSLLPSYLQQLVMESNGKSVNSNNKTISNSPCSFIFGEVGADAQHSFFQALHQSTLSFTADLISFSTNLNSEFCIFDDFDDNHSKDLQNFAISQYFAFKNGSDQSIENPHHFIQGNKPVDLFIFDKLNEYTLGKLLCIYEYKTLFEASFQDINPFDQYGVELGKKIFKEIKTFN